MKKIAMAFVCFALVSISAWGATAAQIMLQHNGSAKLFDSDQMAAAINQAVDGDTIFLTEGSFNNFTVSKKIAIIGAGPQTVITGDVTIAIPGSPTLTARVLDGMNISGNILVNQSVNKFIIRKCKFKSFNPNNTCTLDNGQIDRCQITECLYLGSSLIKSMLVTNSLINNLNSCNNTTTLINCDFYVVTSDFKGTILNSIISMPQNLSNGLLKNTLYSIYNYIIQTGCTTTDCYAVNKSVNTPNKWLSHQYTMEELFNNGFLGDDGTVVGSQGGNTPFTLVPAVPKVTERTIKVDTEGRKLNVSLKVSAN